MQRSNHRKEWTTISSKNNLSKPKKSNPCKTITDQYTVTTNMFTPLSNLWDNKAESNELQTLHEQRKWTNQTSTEITDATPNQHKKGIKIPTLINGRLTCDSDRKPTTRKKEDGKSATQTRPRHKVKILGDSYLRGTAPKIDQYLNTKFEVCSWIKPGATTKEIVDTLGSDLKCLGTQDVIVVNGGMNNIDSKRNKKHKVLVHMAQFIQANARSNIIIVNIPPRHDIGSNSVINLEIQATNRKLNKIAKAYTDVMIVDSNLHRNCFTRHGLHLNKYGKERLSKQIATQIHKLAGDNSKNAITIPLKWEIEPLSKQNPTNPLLDQIDICPIEPNKLNDCNCNGRDTK